MNETLNFRLTAWQRFANPPEAVIFATLFVVFSAAFLFGISQLLLSGVKEGELAAVIGAGFGTFIFRRSAVRLYISIVNGVYINRIDVFDDLIGVGHNEIQRVCEIAGVSIRKGVAGTWWIRNASGVIAVVPSPFGDAFVDKLKMSQRAIQ